MLRRAYYGGAGQSSGDVITTSGTLLCSGLIWFVDSVNGDNANSGQHIEQPKATLVATVAAASDGDIIFLLAGHQEVLTALLTLSKDLTIVGCGKVGDKPSPTIQCNGSGARISVSTGVYAHFRNVRFLERADTESIDRLLLDSSMALTILDDCWFDCKGSDEPTALQVSSSSLGLFVRNTTFQSIAASVAEQTASAWQLSTGTEPTIVENVTFDGGEYGWSTAAWRLEQGHVRAELIGLDFAANVAWETGVHGYFHTLNEAGAGWFSWTVTDQYTYRPGFGGALGPQVISSGRLTMEFPVYYVSSVIGDDTYSGTQRKRPLATLSAALTAANAHSGTNELVFIVLAADHQETFTALLTVADSHRIILGEGRDSSGEPTARFDFNGDGAGIKFSGALCELRNVVIGANQQANTTSRVADNNGGGYGLAIRDCVLECDQYDTVAGISLNGDGTAADFSMARVQGLTIRSVQTDPALAPVTAFEMEESHGVFFENLTVDGGDSGFQQEAVLLDSCENVYMIRTKLLNGADMKFEAMATGDGVWVHFSDESESAYVRSEQVPP